MEAKESQGKEFYGGKRRIGKNLVASKCPHIVAKGGGLANR